MTNDPERRWLLLVADDDEDVLELVCLRLRRAGYDVIEARDGEEALQATCELKPDLVILDVAMPELSGCEVTQKLSEDASTRDIPVILLTASVQEGEIQRGFEAGAVDYVAKPFDFADLGARIEAALHDRQPQPAG